MFCSTSVTDPKGPNNIVIQRAGVVHIHNHYYAGRSCDSEDSKKRMAEWKAASEADQSSTCTWTSTAVTDEGLRQAGEAMRRATEYYKDRCATLEAALSAPGAREADSGVKITCQSALCPTENLQKRLRACLQAEPGDEESEELDDEELEDELASKDNTSEPSVGYDTDQETIRMDQNIADNKESKEHKVSQASQAAASAVSAASSALAAVAKVAKPSTAKGG